MERVKLQVKKVDVKATAKDMAHTLRMAVPLPAPRTCKEVLADEQAIGKLTIWQPAEKANSLSAKHDHAYSCPSIALQADLAFPRAPPQTGADKKNRQSSPSERARQAGSIEV